METLAPRPKRDLVELLAHELRNPLASLQGCAITLQERFADLDDTRRNGLMQVVVDQSQRMDWLIGALAAMSGVLPGGSGHDMHMGEVVTRAASTAGIEPDGIPSVSVPGDAQRAQLGLEALLLALSNGSGHVAMRCGDDGLEVSSPAHDLERGGRAWKLQLARKLLRQQGFSVRVNRTEAGTTARVRFPQGGHNGDGPDGRNTDRRI